MKNNLSSLSQNEIKFIYTHLSKRSYYFTSLIAFKFNSSRTLDLKFIADEAVSESIKSLITSSRPFDSSLTEIQKKSYLNKLLQHRIHDVIRNRTKFFHVIVNTTPSKFLNLTTPYDYPTPKSRKRIKLRKNKLPSAD